MLCSITIAKTEGGLASLKLLLNHYLWSKLPQSITMKYFFSHVKHAFLGTLCWKFVNSLKSRFFIRDFLMHKNSYIPRKWHPSVKILIFVTIFSMASIKIYDDKETYSGYELVPVKHIRSQSSRFWFQGLGKWSWKIWSWNNHLKRRGFVILI